jgi:hypothetical protein
MKSLHLRPKCLWPQMPLLLKPLFPKIQKLQTHLTRKIGKMNVLFNFWTFTKKGS